jgi:ParB family chromosome partitioning protein
MKAKKTSLGRGLDAILQSPDTDITSRDISGDFVAGAVASIRISQIESNPFQPRTAFEEQSLAELSDSIRVQGVIQPITVRKLGYDHYQLISGERRLRAANMAGLKEVPCYIRVANDEQMLEMALIENIHREDLNPVEIAVSYQRLMEECSLTQESLSQKVSKDRATISNYIRLLRLPAEVQLALRNRLLSMGHAKAVLSVADTGGQLQLASMIIEKGLSVREAEKLAQDGIAYPSVRKTGKTNPATSAVMEAIGSKLSEQLSTSVSISRNTNGKGSIVIRFTSEADLDRILTLLRRT